MKKNITIAALLILILTATLAGCTSTVGASSSWPGISVGDDLAVVSYGYQLYALNVQNGSKVWAFPAEQEKNVIFYAPVEFAENMVIAGDYAHNLYAVSSDNGSLIWKFDGAKSRYVTSAFYKNGTTYAPNADEKLYVLDQNGTLQWVFQTDGPNWSKPVADDQYLYLASMDHHIYALNLNYSVSDLVADKEGTRNMVEKPIWKTDLGTAIVSDPLLADGFLYVGTIDGKVFKVNASTGDIVWTYEGETKIKSIWTKPIILDGVLFFATEDGYIFALDSETGISVWDSPMATGSQIVASGVILTNSVGFGTIDGKFVIVDKDQVTSPSLSRAGSIYTTPIFKDGKLYLMMVNGEKLVYALDENGREFWSFSTEE
ncbi:MAG: PQQ-binding-like beta-propeller repeat protein [Anaerolineaceae bacterium]